MDPRELCRRVLAAAETPAPVAPDFVQWRAGFRVSGDAFGAALAAGLSGGRLAWCFAGGYQAALRRLAPSLPAEAFAALLLSEGRRQRPEELETRLSRTADGAWRLDGEKSWVTGGPHADTLLVVARLEDAEPGAEKPRVATALLALPASRAGIAVEARPPAGMLDDLPHGRARFAGVPVAAADRLPGDGWRDYGRPFRTIEDIHVSTAVAAHLAVAALRAGWPDALVASLLACLSRLADCAALDPRDAVTHLLLAGAERELAGVASEATARFAADDSAVGRDWRANAAVLALAGPARGQRLARALAAMRAGA